MRKKKTKAGVDISSTYGMKSNAKGAAWIVVAHRSLAQVFEHSERRSGLKMVREFPYPKGRMKGKDLLSDRPGRSFDSHSKARGGHQTGGPRHSMSSRESPANQGITVLSERVANWLETARQKSQYDELILVAEPHFLGRLKSHFSRQTTRLITEEREKDYSWLKRPQLESRLLSLFPGKPS
ncbi:MAG: host attachment protein [Deltaproteobacteria bacterium]|nr:host attachment protein [Deltaproteobacteria bacterium]MBI3294260.1 host attachment protein [Deltaproteobacteria bacterium]